MVRTGTSICRRQACAEALDCLCSGVFGCEASQNFCGKVVCEASCLCTGAFVRQGSSAIKKEAEDDLQYPIYPYVESLVNQHPFILYSSPLQPHP